MNNRQKILIVDDEPDVVKVVSFRLETLGYEVIVAYDGKDGLLKVKTHKPDLVILDLMLPHIDGFTVCAHIKSDRRYHHIPVIMLTASADLNNKKLSDEVKVDLFLNKPLEVENLQIEIQRLLAHKRDDYDDSLKELGG